MDASRQTIQDLSLGAHACWVYGSPEEHQHFVGLFLQQALRRSEKVVYAADRHVRGLIDALLRQPGPEFAPLVALGQLVILDADEAYFQHGLFNPDAVIARWKAELARAAAEGYSGLRLTGEMTWALWRLADLDQLVQYERAVNAAFPNTNCVAVCQYDRRYFRDSNLLLDVINAHPVAIVEGVVYRNPFYRPP